MSPRVEVMHGVNLDQLGRRQPEHYGTFTLAELEDRIRGWARERGVEAGFFSSNFEGEFVERLHALPGRVDGVILNPGSWTHYAWSLHDALEMTGLPAVEVHISDVEQREPWRRESVIRGLCLATVSGRGAEGYRDALDVLAGALRSA